MAQSSPSSRLPASQGSRVARLMAIHNFPAEVSRKTQLIREGVLGHSTHLRSANFDVIGFADLRRLFNLYDGDFFGSSLRQWMVEDGSGEIALGLSNRMTSAAGKTYMRKLRGRAEPPRYEIAVSTFLLFQNFREGTRSVTVGGLVCNDRLEALQRIIEHELLHLAEFLVWGRSSCFAANFHSLSARIFGHEGTTHHLVTPREVAAETYQIVVGDRVSFEYEGATKIGRVNRITKRATVLCESTNGRRFSDGRSYEIYYIPLAMLSKVNSFGGK